MTSGFNGSPAPVQCTNAFGGWDLINSIESGRTRGRYAVGGAQRVVMGYSWRYVIIFLGENAPLRSATNNVAPQFY